MPKETFYNLSEEKKQKILEASIKEYSRVCPADVLIKNIVEDAGIARGSFYQYFESKEDLLNFILEKDLDEIENFILEKLKEKKGNIFEVYIEVFNFIIARFSEDDRKNFHIKVVEDIKTADDSFFMLNKVISKKRLKGPFQKEEIINSIDKSNFKDENDIDVLLKMLFLVTRKAVVSVARGKDVLEVKEQYIKMLEILKYGSLKS